MIALPLRTRLTLWYSFLLALALGVFALVAFVEMRQTLLASIDSELRNDLEQTRAMIAVTPRSSLQVRFAAHDSDLFQLVAADGSLIFETGAARSMAAPAPDADGTAQTQRAHGVPLRGLSTSFSVGDSGYRLRYWLPVRQYEGAVDRFGVVIMLSIPIVLLVAAGGGIWMSRRALRPLDRIIRDARSITAHNLNRRLELPRSRDELHDLSQTLNEMFDRLEQTFRRVSEFTADASHELRTPVALMRTSAEVALRNPRTAEEYRDVLSAIHEELRTMSRLIDDLLLLARSDAGIDVLELEPVLLADPLREAVVKAEALALTRNIRLRAEIPVAPAVSGHTASLQRLFFALIENAVHYTPEGGEVDVTVVTEDGKATVIIRDSGPGIAAEDLAHIFERFYRADKSRTRQSGGTGLGLPIARRIAALHRGTITVSSSTSGSEFRVLLPLSSQRR